MSNKIVSPSAINALKEALVNIYWYKRELRSFITNTLENPTLISRINWEDYKRNIVTRIIDYLAANQEKYRDDLLRLMSEVIRIEDYTHLEKLEDGKEKARKAKQSVEALRKLFAPHQDVIAEAKAIEERKRIAHESLREKKSMTEKLEELKLEIYKLTGTHINPQERGYILEKIIKELFILFDLDPKASFRITGEQIDGAFTFESTDYLFEAKWQSNPISISDLDAFSGKVSRKLENTLGLYLSFNGYSDDAIKAHSSGRRLMILMDGADLMAVLDDRIDLLQLLLRKRRYAAQTGNIYLPVIEIFKTNDQ